MTEIATKVTVCTGGCDPKCGECGIQKIIPLTAEEIAQREADAEAYAVAEAQRQAEADALTALKTSARNKLVAGQPLTEAEAATLVL